MDETTIAKPLAGPEIVEAICFKVRENLNKNCLFAAHQAYAAFSFDVKVTVNFVNPTSSIKEALGFASGAGGAVGEGETVTQETQTIDIHEDAAPPNQVRRDTEQGVPVRVKTPQGGTIDKKLKYERKEPDAVGGGRQAGGRKVGA